MSTDSNDSVAAEFQRHWNTWGEEDSAAHDALEVNYAALEVKNAALTQENVELRWKASELEQKWNVTELEWKISELRQENADLECGVAHLQEQVRWLEESKLALEQRNRVLLESADHQVHINLAQDYALQGRKVQELKVAIGQLVAVCTPLSPPFVRCPSCYVQPV